MEIRQLRDGIVEICKKTGMTEEQSNQLFSQVHLPDADSRRLFLQWIDFCARDRSYFSVLNEAADAAKWISEYVREITTCRNVDPEKYLDKNWHNFVMETGMEMGLSEEQTRQQLWQVAIGLQTNESRDMFHQWIRFKSNGEELTVTPEEACREAMIIRSIILRRGMF